jgi:hypothetical protein
MSHYAKIENNIVTQVIVAHSKAWCEDALGGEFVQTSYNTRGGIHYGQDGQPDDGIALNKNYAGIGYGWDGVGFYPPKCHDEATLNENTYLWDCTNADHQVKEITDVRSN